MFDDWHEHRQVALESGAFDLDKQSGRQHGEFTQVDLKAIVVQTLAARRNQNHYQQRNAKLHKSLLIISPVTRRAATWILVLELKLFLSNNVRMSTATEMCTARS